MASRARAPDMLAVILVGPGAEMYPLTDPTSSYCPSKALLPIANKPAIDSVLSLIEETTFITELLVLASPQYQNPLSSYLRTKKRDYFRIDVEAVPPEFDKGSASALAYAAKKGFIRSDFMVLPCDLILNHNLKSSFLCSLLDKFLLHEPIVTSLFFERAASNEEKPKDGPPQVITIFDAKSMTLLDMKNKDDLENGEISLRTRMTEKFKSTTLTDKLLPAHLYICARRVVDILAALPKLRSFKDDVIPWIARAQWDKKLLKQVPGLKITAPHSQHIALAFSSTQSTSMQPFLESSTSSNEAERRYKSAASPKMTTKSHRPPLRAAGSTFGSVLGSAYSSTNLAGASADDTERSIFSAYTQEESHHTAKVSIAIWRKEDGFATRANTLPTYSEACRQALKHQPPQSHDLSASTGAGDSLIGAHSVIGEKSSIKKSMIGKSCNIGRMAKVQNSVCMENVVVGDNTKLDNCIVGTGARIGAKVSLTGCTVGPGCEVEPETQAKNEIMTRQDD